MDLPVWAPSWAKPRVSTKVKIDGMARLSETEQEWKERAQLSNYRCRDCKEVIGFSDQEQYFKKGLCTPCAKARDDERNALPDSQRRVAEIRERVPGAE